MYRPGHYGAAMLAYAPVGAALLLGDAPGLALLGGAVAVGLAPLPDYDQRVPFVTHRGVTHTVEFALPVGLVVGGLGWAFADGTDPGRAAALAGVGFVAGTVSVGSHLLADVITPAGITPLWPLSGRRYTFDLVHADNRVANWALFVGGVFVSATVLVGLGSM